MCLSMWAHWRHLANTTELVLPSAHLSPQSKRQIDRFNRSCAGHGRKSLYLQWGTSFPKNCPFWYGSLGPPKSSTLKIASAVFADLTSVTDRQTNRQTDHTTRSVTTDHIYVRSMGDVIKKAINSRKQLMQVCWNHHCISHCNNEIDYKYKSAVSVHGVLQQKI